MADKYVFNLDESDKEYCEHNLNETDQGREDALEHIRKWILEDEPNLNARVDDKYILPFLRGCKFNIDKTKTKIINYYTMRRDQPQWFKNRDPTLPEIQVLVRLGVFVPLKVTFRNMLVVIIRTAAHDPMQHKQDDVFKVGNMILDIAAMENEKAQIYGVVAIFDMAGVSFAHSKELTPRMIKHAVFSWQNYHCRPQQLEFVNAPFYINVVLNIFKQFMTEKLRKRVRVHFRGVGSLYKFVDKDILPPEYGGNGDTMENLIDYWNGRLLGHDKWFAEDETFIAQ